MCLFIPGDSVSNIIIILNTLLFDVYGYVRNQLTQGTAKMSIATHVMARAFSLSEIMPATMPPIHETQQ